jgi:hypothetical protein
MCAQPAEPAEQVGVAAQLGKLAELRKMGVEILQETMGQVSVVADGGGPQGEVEMFGSEFPRSVPSWRGIGS